MLCYFLFSVSDEQETMSEGGYPSQRSQFGRPLRSSSSSRAMIPMRRLDTLKEVPSVDVIDCRSERVGRSHMSRTNSYSDSHTTVARRHLNSSFENNEGSADNLRNAEGEEEEEEEQQPQPLSQAPTWAAEPRDPATRNPLLRQPRWNLKK